MLVNMIRCVRKKKGMTQADLAEIIGVKRTVISKYESGMISPSVDTLVRISEVLGVSIVELLGLRINDKSPILSKEYDPGKVRIERFSPDGEIEVIHMSKEDFETAMQLLHVIKKE